MTLDTKHIWTDLERPIVRRTEVEKMVKEVLGLHCTGEVDAAATEIAGRLTFLFDVYNDGPEDE